MKTLLRIKYDGTDFCGYQVQKDRRTVQGELNRAARELYGYDCNITGCSRTDSGVNALCFYATVTPCDERYMTSIPTANLIRAFNSYLPADISVTDAFRVSDDFHPRYDVVSKEYIYLLNNSRVRDPFMRNRAFTLPRPIESLQLEEMNKAASCLVGEHDFASFMSEGSNVASTVRRIEHAFFEMDSSREIITFRISGNGFLYNMVRIIVGTMLDVAYGKISPSDISGIIESKDRSMSGRTAAPHGLYLNDVVYPVGALITEN